MEVKTCSDAIRVTIDLLGSIRVRACDIETEGQKLTVSIGNLNRIMEYVKSMEEKAKPEPKPESEPMDVSVEEIGPDQEQQE